MTTSKQWVLLASRPEGTPTSDNFRIEIVELPELSDGQILVENTFASVDPYMRGRMNDVESYIPPFQIDEPLTGTAVGTVAGSRSEKIKVGDTVRHFAGWRTHAIVNESEAEPINTDLAPAEAYLGILGLTGLTAYVGLTAVGEMQEGDTVRVHLRRGGRRGFGCRADREASRRIEGGRLGWLRGKDRLHHGPRFRRGVQLQGRRRHRPARQGCTGRHRRLFRQRRRGPPRTAIANANTFGRIAMCGAIAQYNDTEPVPGPRNLGLSIGKCLTLRGFVVGQCSHLAEEFQEKIAPLVVDGSISYETKVRESIEKMPDAFLELFEGGNTGKMIVKL